MTPLAATHCAEQHLFFPMSDTLNMAYCSFKGSCASGCVGLRRHPATRRLSKVPSRCENPPHHYSSFLYFPAFSVHYVWCQNKVRTSVWQRGLIRRFVTSVHGPLNNAPPQAWQSISQLLFAVPAKWNGGKMPLFFFLFFFKFYWRRARYLFNTACALPVVPVSRKNRRLRRFSCWCDSAEPFAFPGLKHKDR